MPHSCWESHHFPPLISSLGKISDGRKIYVLNKFLPKNRLRCNHFKSSLCVFHWVLTKPTRCSVPARSTSGKHKRSGRGMVHLCQRTGRSPRTIFNGHVCVSTGQPGCLCYKDPKTETSDAVSPKRVLAGHQSLSNTCCVPATLPVLSRLIPILYLEAGVLIPVYRQGSGRLMYFAKVTNQG